MIQVRSIRKEEKEKEKMKEEVKSVIPQFL